MELKKNFSPKNFHPDHEVENVALRFALKLYTLCFLIQNVSCTNTNGCNLVFYEICYKIENLDDYDDIINRKCFYAEMTNILLYLFDSLKNEKDINKYFFDAFCCLEDNICKALKLYEKDLPSDTAKRVSSSIKSLHSTFNNNLLKKIYEDETNLLNFNCSILRLISENFEICEFQEVLYLFRIILNINRHIIPENTTIKSITTNYLKLENLAKYEFLNEKSLKGLLNYQFINFGTYFYELLNEQKNNTDIFCEIYNDLQILTELIKEFIHENRLNQNTKLFVVFDSYTCMQYEYFVLTNFDFKSFKIIFGKFLSEICKIQDSKINTIKKNDQKYRYNEKSWRKKSDKIKTLINQFDFYEVKDKDMRSKDLRNKIIQELLMDEKNLKSKNNETADKHQNKIQKGIKTYNKNQKSNKEKSEIQNEIDSNVCDGFLHDKTKKEASFIDDEFTINQKVKIVEILPENETINQSKNKKDIKQKSKKKLASRKTDNLDKNVLKKQNRNISKKKEISMYFLNKKKIGNNYNRIKNSTNKKIQDSGSFLGSNLNTHSLLDMQKEIKIASLSINDESKTGYITLGIKQENSYNKASTSNNNSINSGYTKQDEYKVKKEFETAMQNNINYIRNVNYNRNHSEKGKSEVDNKNNTSLKYQINNLNIEESGIEINNLIHTTVKLDINDLDLNSTEKKFNSHDDLIENTKVDTFQNSKYIPDSSLNNTVPVAAFTSSNVQPLLILVGVINDTHYFYYPVVQQST